MPRPNSHDHELLAMPTIASQLPVQFGNGANWGEFKGECQGCGCEIPAENLRGAVRSQTPSMVSIEASGICKPCNLLTRFVYRLHDDMRITVPRGNGWQVWGGKKPSIFKRIFG